MTHTYTHKTVLWLPGFCLGQPKWASTRRNIHQLTPIGRPLSASSIYYNPWHPPCSTYVPDSHIVVNVSSTIINTNIWFVAALCFIVDVRTYGWMDIFTGFIRSSLRKWPKNGVSGSITFHKSKLHIIYINLLTNSVFEDHFHHFQSMFQHFNPIYDPDNHLRKFLVTIS